MVREAMSALDRELKVLRGFCSCRGDDAAVDEAEAELKALRAKCADLRFTLMELLGRLHAAGRRPEECYEMSLIHDVLTRAGNSDE